MFDLLTNTKRMLKEVSARLQTETWDEAFW